MPTTDHPLFTQSVGDDAWHVAVSIIPELKYRRNAVRLAELSGADYRTSDWDGVSTMVFETSIAGVVDFEHDTSKFAHLEVALPTTVYEGSGVRILVGILTGARLYPSDVDPLTQSDADTDAGWCDPETSGWENHERHRFAPYQPPERDEVEALVGQAVLVELMPQSEFNKREGEEDE